MGETEGRPPYATIRRRYAQKSIRGRLEAFFLDNVGRVATREQLVEIATDPATGRVPENWHQRVSELRTDAGYTILTQRNRGFLKVSEYLMPDATRRPNSNRRARPTVQAWAKALDRHGHRCAWNADGQECGLGKGDVDPVGGGRVRLTPDHKTPHSLDPDSDKHNPDVWQPLCGRHQVMKKNYWDDESGWLNVYGIVQAASKKDKKMVYDFLSRFFDSP